MRSDFPVERHHFEEASEFAIVIRELKILKNDNFLVDSSDPVAITSLELCAYLEIFSTQFTSNY